MFFGEALCLIPYLILRWRKDMARAKAGYAPTGPADGQARRTFRLRRILVFAIPAACDAFATTLLNIGLFYTCGACRTVMALTVW